MPYETRKEGCPEDKPHGVFKKGTDQKMGCHATPEAAGAQIAAMHARENMTTEQVFISNESYVNVTPGEAVRLFPFGELKRGGVTRNITPALASRFRLPNFKPPIKLGSHADEAPAGGHIIGLEVRDDGVYALTETTPKGRLAFDEGDYRYHSPEVIWDEPMEMPDGSKVEPPIILGMALLHTPYLGEAAAIYTHKEKELEMPEETVAVPRTLWDSVVSLFSQKPPAPKSEEPSIKPEEFTALQKERDDYAAKIEAMEAERAKAELLTAIRGEFATEEYGAAFTSLVAGEDAEIERPFLPPDRGHAETLAARRKRRLCARGLRLPEARHLSRDVEDPRGDAAHCIRLLGGLPLVPRVPVAHHVSLALYPHEDVPRGVEMDEALLRKGRVVRRGGRARRSGAREPVGIDGDAREVRGDVAAVALDEEGGDAAEVEGLVVAALADLEPIVHVDECRQHRVGCI